MDRNYSQEVKKKNLNQSTTQTNKKRNPLPSRDYTKMDGHSSDDSFINKPSSIRPHETVEGTTGLRENKRTNDKWMKKTKSYSQQD